MKPLILGLGNDLLSDDGAGLICARRLAQRIGDRADVLECRSAGLSLLDPLTGRSHAVIIDAIVTRREPPGTVYRASPADLRDITNLSPHYAGLPEVIRMAGHLKLPFPKDIEIVAIEADDVGTVGAGLTPRVAAALDGVVALVAEIVNTWTAPSPPSSEAHSALRAATATTMTVALPVSDPARGAAV